ncbi:hypothetical protein CW304_00660 [Bacillus sp. UFRGS-B20]|nr:hypothetical protein CW304_00660 [Bacillus sp. UFRGS-B20]
MSFKEHYFQLLHLGLCSQFDRWDCLSYPFDFGRQFLNIYLIRTFITTFWNKHFGKLKIYCTPGPWGNFNLC